MEEAVRGLLPDISQATTGNHSKGPTPMGAGPLLLFLQSGWRDLNPRPLRPERSALPSCATPRSNELYFSGLIPVREIRFLWGRRAGLTWGVAVVIKGVGRGGAEGRGREWWLR
ncbi:hypothetical protein SSP35_05_03930 [Streptomyces sp. NBRC 110611]|nr:hypothetical protein SSP35_05_03930 [Streptomyces sp. NBRC 110611]